MRPLVYLTVRSFVNGIKRATRSARRLISLLALIFWYLFAFVRPFDRPSGRPEMMPFHAPSATIVEGFLFAVFSVLSLLLMLGVFSYRGNFRPADVDVLFATPVSPRLVLVFRIFRDYVFTLLLPLFFAIFFYKPASAGLAAFISKNPETSKYVSRVATVAWILMALFWVCGGYALSLWANRSDIRAERNRKILGWAVAALIVGVIGFIVNQIRTMTSPDEMLVLAHSPFLRTVFFTSTLATEMVMGTVNGSLLMTFGAGGILVVLILISLQADFRQVGWMYDQAASRGTDAQTLRSLQSQGDMIGMMAERARKGKVRFKRQTWFHRLRMKGAAAIIWKEIVILMRSSSVAFAMTVPIVFGLVIIPVVGLSRVGSGLSGVVPATFLAMSMFGVFILSLSLSQAGFIEMLRRVDLEKPLPFSAAQIVGSEVFAKVIPVWLVSGAASIVVVAIRPAMWQEGIVSFIGIPFCAALISGIVLLMTVLFPDVDDPTQRGFRGLMIMLALLIAGTPCIGIYAVMRLVSSPILAGLVSSALAGGIFAAVTAVAGNLYASFNPSE